MEKNNLVKNTLYKLYKQILTVIIVIVLVCPVLSSCGTNSISLTLDNYTDYLDVSGSYNMGGRAVKPPRCSFYVYPEIENQVQVKGASSNYIYNNVELVVNISGTYKSYPNTDITRTNGVNDSFSETFTIRCDKGGNGSQTVSTKLSGYTYKLSTDLSFDVVSVSGSVKEAN